MNNEPVTHFADDHTLRRLSELERENALLKAVADAVTDMIREGWIVSLMMDECHVVLQLHAALRAWKESDE